MAKVAPVVFFLVSLGLTGGCHQTQEARSGVSTAQPAGASNCVPLKRWPDLRRVLPTVKLVHIPATKHRPLKHTDPDAYASPEETKVLDPWQCSRDYYGTIDPYSRMGGPPPTCMGNVTLKVSTLLDELNRFVEQKGIGEGEVYRGQGGLSQGDILELIDKMKNRQPHSIAPEDRVVPLPIATTTNVVTALNFACRPGELLDNPHAYGVIYRIWTKQGYQLPWPYKQRESEVLISPKQQYRIKKIDIFDVTEHDFLLKDRPRIITLKDLCQAFLVDLEELPGK